MEYFGLDMAFLYNEFVLFSTAELVDEEKVHPGIFGGPNRHAKHRKEEKTSKALQQYNESKPTKEISNKRKALLESIGYEVCVSIYAVV